jgi:D-serine deaminase-like pyridoxal phosphate-dependent protein
MLGRCGAEDVLLAYQPVGPKMQRFIRLILKYPKTVYSCLADNMQAAETMAAAFRGKSLNEKVYIDLNVGQDRTGISPGPDALELYKKCCSLNGLHVAGIHAYDGHIRDKDFDLRKARCDRAFEAVESMKQRILEIGLPEPVIIAGGSPTFPVHAAKKNVQCSPGTFVYWDKTYLDMCAEQGFLPAALLIARVISLPAPLMICVDLGHKSVAAENDIASRVYFLNAPGLVPHSQNEEHLVLAAGAGHDYQIGDILYGLPWHICPTVALYERVYTVYDHLVTGEWKNIARDRQIEC